jgi:murein L,D-transpeptidase YafK
MGDDGSRRIFICLVIGIGSADTKADLLVVEKGGRRLLAYSHGSLLREYPVSLGRSPVGPKERQGDRRTPGVTM